MHALRIFIHVQRRDLCVWNLPGINVLRMSSMFFNHARSDSKAGSSSFGSCAALGSQLGSPFSHVSSSVNLDNMLVTVSCTCFSNASYSANNLFRSSSLDFVFATAGCRSNIKSRMVQLARKCFSFPPMALSTTNYLLPSQMKTF